MPIFRTGQGKHALTAAMAAVKMGDRLLQVGCTDGALLGAIASKAGLSGRACLIVESEAGAARGRAGAAQSGTLLEVEIAPLGPLPYDDRSFDVVVIDSLNGLIARGDPAARAACLRDVRRVLAPRGRVVVIERVARPGLAGWFSREPVDPGYRAAGGAAAVLKAEGFGVVRILAERDGLSFVEALG
jgi:ubiquinone/menaquinone biosynthesis C-methylase UbiE